MTLRRNQIQDSIPEVLVLLLSFLLNQKIKVVLLFG